MIEVKGKWGGHQETMALVAVGRRCVYCIHSINHVSSQIEIDPLELNQFRSCTG